MLAIALFLPSIASAELRLEVLGGACKFGKVGNYVWYNEHYQHDLDLTSPCGIAAVSSVSRNLGTLHLGWRIAYVNMGKAKTNAVFPMRDDEQISVLPDGSNCNPITWNGCIGRGRGAQSAVGFSFGYLAQKDWLGATWDLEGGLFVYEGRWRVDIQPEAPSNFHPVNNDWEGYQVTPFIGMSVRYGYAMAMVRSYGRIKAAEHGCGVCSGVANGTTYQVLMGLSKPF